MEMNQQEFPTREAMVAALFVGCTAELGVATGVFSQAILAHGSPSVHYAIDRWNDDRHGPKEYLEAAKLLCRFGNCVVLRMSFSGAAQLFPDEHFQAVYIDGYAHTGQDAGRTLAEWWPKIKPGGIMAGHDYHPDWPLTVAHVDEFVAAHGLELHTTQEYRQSKAWPSWWVRKPIE